ncbi:MAG: M20/M25/M40 family metallo-hydrolase [Thermoleophilia bacterium]
MMAAAGLVSEEIRRAGGTVEIRRGDGHPLVIGDPPEQRGSGRPRVILYGHYDVQPVGDRALWTDDPFEPVEQDGNLYCRGAGDDKGNLFMLLAAVQRLRAADALPVHVSFIVDGEGMRRGQRPSMRSPPTTGTPTRCSSSIRPWWGPERPACVADCGAWCTAGSGFGPPRVTRTAASSEARR